MLKGEGPPLLLGIKTGSEPVSSYRVLGNICVYHRAPFHFFLNFYLSLTGEHCNSIVLSG
jgi:hypothetical protein